MERKLRMMRRIGVCAAVCAFLYGASPAYGQRVESGDVLPAFMLVDTEGRVHRSADYAGRPMVVYLIGHN